MITQKTVTEPRGDDDAAEMLREFRRTYADALLPKMILPHRHGRRMIAHVRVRRHWFGPEMLEPADLETIRKLLTLHVRKERFCEGHLLGMFESGHLTKLLRRLHAIRRDMT